MRPQLEIEKQPLDNALELTGLIGVLVMIALPIYYWGEIPSIVPTHFSATGQPNDYGSKWTTISLPLIGALLYFGLNWITRFPHKFNYPLKITKDNAAEQYRMATRLVRLVGTLVALSFAYLTYTIIHTSLGTMEGPGSNFVLVFTVSILLVPFAYLIMTRRQST
jgi:uncharacterized membrane protein